jgi:hypothetical protein
MVNNNHPPPPREKEEENVKENGEKTKDEAENKV